MESAAEACGPVVCGAVLRAAGSGVFGGAQAPEPPKRLQVVSIAMLSARYGS